MGEAPIAARLTLPLLMWDALPENAARFVQRLHRSGFNESRREPGTMDSGLITFRRDRVEITLVKDRSQWSLDVRVDGWKNASVAFPLLEGFGIPELRDDDSLAPRRDRDLAGSYDVPASVRWLIRILLGAGFAKKSQPNDQSRLVFHRDPLTVRLQRDLTGWSVHLDIEGLDEAIALPRFEGFADSRRPADGVSASPP